MLIVLGLDSLDFNRIQDYRTPALDGLAELRYLNTPDRLGPGELKTQLLWPSLLCGVHPLTRFSSYYGDEAKEVSTWNNPLLNNPIAAFSENLFSNRLSREHKEYLKRLLQFTGTERESETEEAVRSESSLYTAAESPNLISIPGVNEDPVNRDLKQMLVPGDNYELDVTPTEFERAGWRADSDRLIRTLTAIDSREPDFLMTHFYALDLVQHLWPQDDRKLARWYGLYDDILSRVLASVDSTDIVVVVSDHGMQRDGRHSTRAVFGCSESIWSKSKCNFQEFKPVLEELLSRHKAGEETVNESVEIEPETASHLEDLGYF